MRHQWWLAMNALDPDQMTAAERLAEVADLMAAALIRLQQRKSSSLSGDLREISLDFSANQRGDAAANGLLEGDG